MDNYTVNTQDLEDLSRLLVKQTYDCWPSSNKEREELLLEVLKRGLKEVVAKSGKHNELLVGYENASSPDALEWLSLIRRQELEAKHWDNWPSRVSATYRSRLVNISALALSAIQAWDLKVEATE